VGVLVATADFVITRRQTDDAWMNKGACRGMTHLFFPSSAERPQARERREAEAREVCASCPVQNTCRQFARENHEYGLWGGESEDERHDAGFRLIAPIGIRAAG
jgi:WhiB family transcriptional regulator, redox-sensing transcriptional regulator